MNTTEESLTSLMDSSEATQYSTKYWYTSLLTMYFVISLCVVAGNTLTAIAYFTTPHLQTLQNLVICNLSLADAIIAVLSKPFFALSYTEAGIVFGARHKWVCLVSLWAVMGSGLCGILCVFVLSLERLLAIIFPFRYYTWVTDNSVRAMIVFVWAFAFTLTAFPLMGLNTWTHGARCFTMFVYTPTYNVYVATNLNVLILVAMALMNITIAVVAVKQNKVNIIQSGSTQNTGQYKVTKMLLTVIGVFYLCWIPYIVLTAIFTMTKHLPEWFALLQDLSKLLIGMNSVLNPLIYARGNEKFRAAFARLLRRAPRVSSEV
ncbi:hypothetical protein CAPTEDRAFT_210567 [Capitella teleta]|uniref:G-protein coupled receptors family 1 profile domain-containing protein n=1 Tax=Capitella teleta TaxID=283909 RepID=R7TGU0_CAPTE|nr:hypothetical protein CAPTEDRAFT_210567 [Capitella teleta]|eukprot:ELT93028.1 hypothetical protein CAPTEDRAFT_210567 [Capitella teleta]